ncbi:PH domain-containing protein [Agromyces humatus]|uniref:PH domain-containing protein n=1 Tax=Agromyces humatus TaxID=279573 RepID=A0ABP4X7W1_9MICO|nr:PH domain-containing protein [Agromyces humatus]
MTITSRPETSVWRRVGRLAKRVLMFELRIYASIARFVARRPAIPHGAVGFGFHKPVLTILIVFIVLSAVEIPIIDLIVHPWPGVRIPLLVLGIWGVTWMIGLLCAYLMRPHTVGPDGIRVRGGLETDIVLSWDDIASVARNRRVDQPKSPKFVEADGSRTLVMRINDETDIEIELERPTVVRLPGHGANGGDQAVTAVRIWVDDPQRFMDEVRTYL